MGTLVLQEQTSASVSTPVAGDATVFIDSADEVVKQKKSDASVVPLGMTSAATAKLKLFVDPMADYGAKFDHRVLSDGACNVGTPSQITSATAAFVSTDVGKRIVLTGAGAAGAQYVGAISAIVNGTTVSVSPNVSTTVSAKALQIHTDDLTAWTNLINDINAYAYAGAVVKIEAPTTGSTFTGRSGISGALPTITKQVQIDGFGGSASTDIGDYSRAGGCCLVWVGTNNGNTFGAVLTFAPPTSATGQGMKSPSIRHFWIDCRNGDQNQALKGISFQSCSNFELNDVFINDPLAVGVEFQVIGPGNASALGEAKDCKRGRLINVSVRALDNPTGAVTTAITTSSAVTLTAAGQSLTVAANALPASGYLWIMTSAGYPVLVNYTGGGGTTTLTGCTVSAMDAIDAPATVNGSNVVQAVPGNACCFRLDGDLTANANFIYANTCQLSHGTTWGPAAIEFKNSDSNELVNVVINGGNVTNDGAINRIRKPGVRLNGSNTNVNLPARNNCFKSGSAGVGGVSIMGVLNSGTRLLSMSLANYWDEYQLGNGEALPTIEGNASFDWTPNGALRPGPVGGATVPVADLVIAAATLTQVPGSLFAIPPQGFQIGTTYRWMITGNCATAAGTAANTITVRIGTAGTTADTAIATFTTGVGSAATAPFKIVILFTVRTLGAAATAVASCLIESGALGVAGGFIAQLNNIILGTMATFNSTTASQFISVALLTGAAKPATITICAAEVLKSANP